MNKNVYVNVGESYYSLVNKYLFDIIYIYTECAKSHFTLLKIYHTKTKKDRNVWLYHTHFAGNPYTACITATITPI